MTVARISQQRDVSLGHAVPYEEIHCLLFSQFFFENAGNNDKLLGLEEAVLDLSPTGGKKRNRGKA